MRKKTIIIIVVLVILASAYIVFGFNKETKLKYTTVKVVSGEVLQTVSATGTVDAETKLDLRFVNSGKIKEINVKVGDYVESKTVLAGLNITQLESQLNRAIAGLNAATANFNKLISGATPENIKISETAVDNAQIVLDNSIQNLLNTEEGAVGDISNAKSSVESAQVSVDNAVQSFHNVTVSNENNLNKSYDDAWNVINSVILIASNSLDTNETILDNEDAQNTLSVLDTQYLNNSSQSRMIAGSFYDNSKNYFDEIKQDPTSEEIDESLLVMKIMLEKIRDTLSNTSDVLVATIISSRLSQTELDTLKSSNSSLRSSVNTAISNITLAEQNISTCKITNQINIDNAQAVISSANSALNLANQSFLAIQASLNSKVNMAENSVKSAEGALKQAQDQLSLKLANPNSYEISLHRAQIQEAQSSVDLIKGQINDSILIAPQAGIITEINKEIGETISSAEIFISMITVNNFEIKANISEVDIAKVKIGDKVEITFDALGLDKEFKGTIAKINPAQTEISGVVYYEVSTIFSGNAEVIKPGMTANFDIITAQKENVIKIPFQALKEKDGKKYVQILKNDKVKDIFVEVGLKGDIDFEIISGLEIDSEVVTFTEM